MPAADGHQRGALARAVDAEECHDLAGHEGQADAAQRVDVAEGLVDVRRLKGGRGVRVHGSQSALVLMGPEVSFDAGGAMTNVRGVGL